MADFRRYVQIAKNVDGTERKLNPILNGNWGVQDIADLIVSKLAEYKMDAIMYLIRLVDTAICQ